MCDSLKGKWGDAMGVNSFSWFDDIVSWIQCLIGLSVSLLFLLAIAQLIIKNFEYTTTYKKLFKFFFGTFVLGFALYAIAFVPMTIAAVFSIAPLIVVGVPVFVLLFMFAAKFF